MTTLDKGQIVAFMIAIATAALTAAWTWLQGWQQYVADGRVTAIKKAKPAKG